MTRKVFCFTLFTTVPGFYEMVLLLLFSDKNIKCKFCDFTTNCNAKLKRHVGVKHSVERVRLML